MTYDYETRWYILWHLIHNEMRTVDDYEKYKIEKGEEARRIWYWMIAIDAGIRDVESRKEMKAGECEK